jgi:hypothetical protein
MSHHCRTLALLSTLIMPGLSGCSLIGVIVGSQYDSARAVTRVDTVLREGIGPYENRISVVSSSGDTCTGELLEVTRTETCTYRDWYSRWQTSQQGARFAPSLGDTVSLILKADAHEVAKGVLLGFTEQAVIMQTSSLYSTRDLETPFADIDTVIDRNGNRTAGADLQRDAKNGVLPMMTAIPAKTEFVVALNGRDSTFTMDDVRWVELTYTERTAIGKTTGLVVGLAIDAVIVATTVFISSGGMFGGARLF